MILSEGQMTGNRKKSECATVRSPGQYHMNIQKNNRPRNNGDQIGRNVNELSNGWRDEHSDARNVIRDDEISVNILDTSPQIQIIKMIIRI